MSVACRHCGAQIAEKALICYRCGAATTEPAVRSPAGRRSGTPSVAIIVTVILVAVLAGAAFYLLVR